MKYLVISLSIIEERINELNEEINEIHVQRNNLINKYGGISDEDNQCYLSDIAFKNSEQIILKQLQLKGEIVSEVKDRDDVADYKYNFNSNQQNYIKLQQNYIKLFITT
jgi:hypothetical protein